jgi:hypothetical protein
LKANAAAADLMKQQHCQIERKKHPAEHVVFDQIHFSMLE